MASKLVRNFLNLFVKKSGDTMTGPLVIDDPTSGVSLDIVSDNSGGLNVSDSTGRINLHSYQKAQEYADDGTTLAHFGEVIRIDMEHKQAKGVIAFRENYLGAPEGARTVAWLVAHGEANDSTPGNPLWHNHFSIELPDEDGQLQTSFEFPFATYNLPNGFGLPTTEMYNRSTTQLIAANRGLVAENAAGVAKNIYFSSGTRGLDANRRWGMQADSTAESGASAGTNFRINRYDDTGTFVDSVVFIRRSDKQVGINTTSPSAQLDVVGTTELNGDVSIPSASSALSIGNAAAQGGASLYIEKNANGVGMIFRNTTVAGNTAANIVSQSQTDSSRAFQAGLQSDSVNRFSIEHSGLIEWGAGGASSRDTNLYRNAANELKTDDSLAVAANSTTAGYTRVGSNSAPANTTAGDITGTRLSLGNGAFSGSNGRIIRLDTTNTVTSGTESTIGVLNAITPASNSSAEYRAIYFQNVVNPTTGITFTSGAGIRAGYFENRIRSDGNIVTLTGIQSIAVTTDSSAAATLDVTTARGYNAILWNRTSGTTTGTIGTGVGYDTSSLAASGGLTATSITGFMMRNPAANAITTLVGVDVEGMTRGSTNIGMRIGTPSGGATANYALQLSGTGGTAASGITFGTDTTLYRSAADTLKTDDALVVDSTIATKAGTSTGQIAKVGGTIFSYTADAGNSGTTETDLYTDSIPANTLATNKDKIEAKYAGEMVNSATATRQLKVYFGGSVIFDTGALSLSASSDWDLEVLIIRVSSTVVRYTCKLNLTGASLSAYCNVGELTGLTLSNANTLKITGQAAGVGAATNDLVARLGNVEWKPAP